MTNPVQASSIILPVVASDLSFVYWLFEQAMAYQRANGFIGWHTYDKAHIASDVDQGLVFKLQRAGAVAAIFSVCYADALIWRERERGDALYLHRAVVHPDAHGGQLFGKIMDWARAEATQRQLDHIRMDTWADNEKLIGYYLGYGFRFVENYTTANDPKLPAQHRNLKVALLELAIR